MAGGDEEAVSLADAGRQLFYVNSSRVSQLLTKKCIISKDAELESPQGPPNTGTRVNRRTISQDSIDAYTDRHERSLAGRWVHPRKVENDEMASTSHSLPTATVTSPGSPEEGNPFDLSNDGMTGAQELRARIAQLEEETRTERRRTVEAKRHAALIRYQAASEKALLEHQLELQQIELDATTYELAEVRSTREALDNSITQDSAAKDLRDLE